MTINIPHIIDLPVIGSSNLGFISVAEYSPEIPFDIKRVYWTYYTPHDVQRGFHAHKELHQLIIAVAGVIDFDVEMQNGEKFRFLLDMPSKGLYLPPLTWRSIKFTHNAVMVCLASDIFKETDYIRDYEAFKQYYGT